MGLRNKLAARLGFERVVEAPPRFVATDARDRNAARVAAALRSAGVECAARSDEDPFQARFYFLEEDRAKLAEVVRSLIEEDFVVEAKARANETAPTKRRVYEKGPFGHGFRDLDEVYEAVAYCRYTVDGMQIRFPSMFGALFRFFEVKDGWYEGRYAPKTFGAPPTVFDPMEYSEPVDVVFTWVDGGDERWLARKRIAEEKAGVVHPHAVARERFDSRDDLRFSVRSVLNYMPWARRIHIVTDGQTPSWLRETERVRIVDHRDIFPDDATLPTFNSHAIESVLHRIPGLSEVFVYMNDDFFIRRPLLPSAFVGPNGVTKVFLSQNRIPVGPVEGRDKASEWGAMNASALLASKFGKGVTFYLRHAPYVLTKSGMQAFEADFPETFSRVRNAPFRSRSDIAPVCGGLHHALWTGRAVPAGISYGYVDLGSPDWETQLRDVGRKRGCAVFCLNDAETSLADAELAAQKSAVRDWLNRTFPGKVECES